MNEQHARTSADARSFAQSREEGPLVPTAHYPIGALTTHTPTIDAHEITSLCAIPNPHVEMYCDAAIV